MTKEIMTVLSGMFISVVVFILSRFVEKIFLDPIKEHRNAIAEIYDGIIYYSNRISNPLQVTENTSAVNIADYNKTSDEIRRMSTKLRAATYNLKGVYWLYRLIFRAPKLADISHVCRSLIGISNGLLYRGDRDNLIDFNIDKKAIIMKKLKLDKFESKIEK